MTLGYASTGGIVGCVGAAGNIQYCYNVGRIDSYYRGVGGITGYVGGAGKVLYCYNIGDIYNNTSTTYTGRTAGIVGYIANTNLTMTDCWQLTGCVKLGEDNNGVTITEKTEAQIKALTWDNYTTVEGEYPVLTWEVD